MRAILLLAACLAFTPAQLERHELPASHVMHVDGHKWAEDFHLVPGVIESVECSIAFSGVGDEPYVRLTYQAHAAGATWAVTVEDVHPTSFRPTAVCKRAGAGSSFFVAGFDEEAGHSVIEEWTLPGPYALGTAPRPNGKTTSTFELPPVIRRPAFPHQEPLPPIRSMAYLHTARQLWLLQTSEPRELLHVIDLDSGARVATYDDEEIPGLQDRLDLTAVSNRHAGAGLLLRNHFPWVDARNQPDGPRAVLVLWDHDRDGTIDAQQRLDRQTWWWKYPLASWDMRYREAPR